MEEIKGKPVKTEMFEEPFEAPTNEIKGWNYSISGWLMFIYGIYKVVNDYSCVYFPFFIIEFDKKDSKLKFIDNQRKSILFLFFFKVPQVEFFGCLP